MNRRTPGILALAALIGTGIHSGLLKAQTQPAFEVATVKPAASDAVPNRVMPSSPDRLSIPSMTLSWLIYTAYGEGMSTSIKVTGGPDWINRTSYAIEARARQASTPRQLRVMLRALLEDRFALKLHDETRMGDVYALVLDGASGKLGPNIQPWDRSCTGRPFTGDDDDPFTPLCPSGYRTTGLALEGATMFSAAEVLSLPQSRNLLGTIVQDQTGLKGRYTMHLDFAFNAPRPADPSAPAQIDGPSLFTAVREQWGMKLERSKGPLRVIVVDSAQPPAAN